MTEIDDRTRQLFSAATERYHIQEAAYRTCQRDATAIKSKVVGKQIVVRDERYEITDVHGGYDGTIHARGYRILGNGKRGSKTWDIGFICAKHFDDAA